MMRVHGGLLSFGLSMALAACAGEVGPDDPAALDAGGGDPFADATPGNGGADATPGNGGTADAGGQTPLTYPPGPYGTSIGSVISNRAFVGYLDTAADPDSDPYNEPPHPVTLADFYVNNDAKSRLLLMIQSAGWCGPCQEEASHMPPITAQWQPRGIRFMTGMWQNPDGSPGSTDYAKEWADMFGLNTSVVADPEGLASQGFGGEGIPFFVLVDTKTMTIVDFPFYGIQDMGSVFEQYAD